MHVAARVIPSLVVAVALFLPRTAHPVPIQFAEREVFLDQGYTVFSNLDDSALLEMVGAFEGDIVIRRNLGGRHFAEPIHIPMATSGISRPTIVDLNGDGRMDLVTTRSSSPALLVRLNLGGLTFGPVLSYPLAGSPWSAAAGNLDADSNGDLVLVAETWFAVFLGNPSGVLTPLPIQPLDEAYRYGAQLADLNGDGRVDLVLPSFASGDNHFEWRAGLGDGTFDGAQSFAPSLVWVPYFSLVDFDHDGDLDFANPGEAEIRCLLNDGSGQFTTAPSISLEGTRSQEYTIAAGDLDLDGAPDLVLAGYCGGRVHENHLAVVVYSAFDGASRRIERWHLPTYPALPLVLDLDGDGYPEVTVFAGEYDASDYFGYSNNNTAILWSDGHGRLLGKLHIPLGANTDPPLPWGMIGVSAGPARPADLITTTGGAAQLLRNRGDGSFASPRDLGFGEPVAAADCDGDGLDEVFVVSSDSLWMLHRNVPDADFGAPSLVNTGSHFLGIADLDGDGTLDLVIEKLTAGNLYARPGDGAGSFGSPRDLLSELPPMHGNVLLDDFDGDGWTDLATGTPVEQDVFDDMEAGVLHLLANDGSGGFSPAVTDTVLLDHWDNWQGGATLVSGDVDGDGDRDIVIHRSSIGATAWFGVFLNHGQAGFDAFGMGRTIGNPGSTIACADLDGDGLADILTHDIDGLDLDFRIFQATGGGTFAEPQWRIGVHFGSAIVVSDFNADGRPDVAMLSGNGSVGIFYNSTPFGPTPTQLSLVSARVVDGAVQLEWIAPGPEMFSATLERSDGAAWRSLASLTSDGLGQVRYRDADVARGNRYGYRLRYRDGARELLTAESWVELPALAFALRAPSPSPVRGVPAFGVSLPVRGDAALEILDIAGRRVRAQRLSGLAPGDHRVTLEGAPLSPGLYFARLRLAEASARVRFVVIR